MLSTRVIMMASSGALFVAGVALLFAPDETLRALGLAEGSAVTGQVLGALYLGAAAANWVARGSMIGGIYARPLTVANFVHFVIGATVLARGIAGATLNVGYVCVTLGYLVFAILFVSMLFGRAPR